MGREYLMCFDMNLWRFSQSPANEMMRKKLREAKETFGDMVQCDDCERWFHLQCVRLSEPPTEVKSICSSCMWLLYY